MVDGVVEKEVTEDLLESALISFGPKEQERLALPEHSGDVKVSLDGEEILAAWNARSRHLSGEDLAERLQEYAQVGWLLRFHHRAGELRLAIVERVGRTLHRDRFRPRSSAPPTAPTKTRQPRRGSGDRYRLLTRDAYRWTGPVGLHAGEVDELGQSILVGGWDPLAMLELRLEGEHLAALDQFEELLAVDVAKVDRMDHQEAAARKVLTAMQGRGVLADEVGLGKTIEAGLVLKELRLRGLVDRVLILCPATLREQWRAELAEKFDEDFDVAVSGYDPALSDADRLIVSLNLGVRNWQPLNRQAWDLVIVDEAHRLAGGGAHKTRAAIQQLTGGSRYVLFLTATPVQNDLLELYRLVELLRPGTFPTQRAFKQQFVDHDDLRKPVRADELRTLVSQVMVRTTRAQAGLDNVARHPVDVPLELTRDERQLYQLCTQALREVMNEPADAHRRRTLAHRLTASPTSLAASALRMSDRHPDSRASEVLKEIGHLAADITGTAREQQALVQIERWVDEHGRVLVFTQHTDTVQGLLKVLDRVGIEAKPFHGGMAAEAKARSIEAFRGGSAPVLISTDAGAEGQNLQFCNCVLNYDLPWNPMRIEQRIGRVHRVTQTRDVHVANFFALGTIDEHVYRLLHDKLRMFELLFGQVTTILGELDQADGNLTFEGRILEALVAPDDSAMKARIDKLGKQLADATARADEQIGADEGLSAWLADSKVHRAALTKEGASELRPEVVKRRRQRQASLVEFVRRYLEAVGAEVLHKVGDRFLSARLPEAVADEIGGASTLHLAFDRQGLDEHPEAELCAVGSEVFEEIVRSLRRRGDLHAEVAVPPSVSPTSPTPHDDAVELVSRAILPPATWTATSTWRASAGDAGHEEIVEVGAGPGRRTRRKRVPLPSGQALPASLGDPKAIVSGIWTEAASSEELRALSTAATRERDSRRDAEQANRLAHLDERLIELRTEQASTTSASKQDRLLTEILNLERVRSAYAQGTGSDGPVEVRAHPLTVRFRVGDELLIGETWRHRSGTERAITYPWLKGDPAPEHQSEAGGPVEVLTLCQDGHLIDAGQQFSCDACGGDWCEACGPAKAIDTCRLCATEVCGRCRPGGLCPGCRDPERRMDLDTSHERAWQLGGEGHLLFVGARSARLQDGGEERTIVPDRDVDDDDRILARAVAVGLGLPPDAGVQLVGGVPDEAWDGPAVFSVEHEVTVELTTVEGGGSDLDPSAVELLSKPPREPGVVAERGLGLGLLLADLRDREPPPPPPAIAVRPRREVTVIDLAESGLRRRHFRRSHDGETELIDETRAELTPVPEMGVRFDRTAPFIWVAEATIDDVTAELYAVHRSYVLDVTSPRLRHRYFAAGYNGATLEDERAVADYLAHLGVDTATHVDVDISPWEISSWAAPTGARLGSRAVDDVWRLVILDEPGRSPRSGRPATAADLEILEIPPRTSAPVDPWDKMEAEPAPDVDVHDLIEIEDDDPDLEPNREESVTSTPLDGQLREALVAWANRATLPERPRAGITIAHRVVDELWVGEGDAECTYIVERGDPAWPWLDDEQTRASDFEVDAAGHLHRAGMGWTCGACTTSYCVACDAAGELADCSGCGKLTCGNCREGGPHKVKALRCGRCGFHSCSSCGRSPKLTRCPTCDRRVCAACFADGGCATCRSLLPAGSPEIEMLPEVLAADGLEVLMARDDLATVAVLRGEQRLEIAVVSGEALGRWITLEDDDKAEDLGLRIGLSRAHPMFGEVILELLSPVDPPAEEEAALRVGPPPRHAVRFGDLSKGPTHETWISVPLRSVTDDALRAVEDALPEALVPSVVPRRKRTALRKAIAEPQPGDRPGPTTVGIQVVEDVEAIRLTARGLIRNLNLSEQRTERAQWLSAPLPSWATRPWDPTPTGGSVATIGGVEAVLVAHGAARALGVRHDDEVTWWRLRDDADEIRRLLFGAQAGRPPGTLVDVSAVAPPSYDPPSILGARMLGRDVSSTVLPDQGSADLDLLHQLVDNWQLEAVTPDLVDLSHPLGSALVEADPVKQVDRREVVAIGMRVSEVWANAHQQQRSVSYDVKPGEKHALVVADDTGEALAEVELDREGHLAARPESCTYCSGRTCRRCRTAVSWCEICRIPVCGLCADQRQPDHHLCGACARLKGTTRWAHRRLDIDVPPKASVWTGTDTVHKVYCVNREGVWAVTVDAPHRGRFTIDLNASQVQLLDELTGRPAGD